VDVAQLFDGILFLERFGCDPVEIDPGIIGDATVRQRFRQRLIGVGQVGVFADDRNLDFAIGKPDAADDLAPDIEIRRHRRVEAKMTQHLIVETFLVIVDRHLVNGIDIECGHHRLWANIAEQADLVALGLWDRPVAAAHHHVGANADALQFLHRVLGRLGLQLAGGRQIGHQRQMDEHRPVRAQFVAQLTDRFEKRQAFDVANGAANFADHEVLFVQVGDDEFLDRVGDVGDHLDRAAEIVTAPLLAQNVGVYPASGHVVRFGRGDAGEPLIVTEVEIGLCPIVGDVDLAVFDRAHGAWIDIEVGVEFAYPHAISARLQQGA
jgi:hypothetical protein